MGSRNKNPLQKILSLAWFIITHHRGALSCHSFQNYWIWRKKAELCFTRIIAAVVIRFQIVLLFWDLIFSQDLFWQFINYTLHLSHWIVRFKYGLVTFRWSLFNTLVSAHISKRHVSLYTWFCYSGINNQETNQIISATTGLYTNCFRIRFEINCL